VSAQPAASASVAALAGEALAAGEGPEVVVVGDEVAEAADAADECSRMSVSGSVSAACENRSRRSEGGSHDYGRQEEEIFHQFQSGKPRHGVRGDGCVELSFVT